MLRLLRTGAIALSCLYVVALILWYLSSVLIGDRSAFLFAVNAIALYFFLPLPLLLLCALVTRSRIPLGGALIGVLLWGYVWGPLFLPQTGRADAAGESITVMTYNLLGYNTDTSSIIESIRESGADVVALQELSDPVTKAIEENLSSEYPYQYLSPHVTTSGMGLISRLPATLTGDVIADPDWLGAPQVMRVDFEGREITVVNFHTVSLPRAYELRERQAEALSAFAGDHEGPLILLGDFNATSTNTAYRTITEHLSDSWREAGRGFGHTFPGASKKHSPSSSRPAFLGMDLPQWLIRIDYIFHSEQWHTISAETGRFDGMSDHRPVVAKLTLK